MPEPFLDRSVFAGMSPQALQAALNSAQKQYIALMSGQQVVTVAYGEGTGTKSVTYRQNQKQDLVNLIGELQACLGLKRYARHAFRSSF